MPTVLLVDDDEDNRRIYSDLLEREGYRVLQAADGQAAVALAREARPDVVVMDLAMPRMDGCEAATRLKADPETRPIPVLALTAHILDDMQERALAAGCEAFLEKPLEPRQLLAEVRRALGEPGGAELHRGGSSPG
jgi:two-component system cell cycle response regulator DivK